MTDTQIKACTVKIKAMADVRRLAIEDTDSIITAFYSNLNSTDEERPLLAGMTAEEKDRFEEKERELNGSGREKRKLDELVGGEEKDLAAAPNKR